MLQTYTEPFPVMAVIEFQVCFVFPFRSLTVHDPDEELDEWRKHLNEFPKEWINGYDKKFAIKEQQLYDLKAIPTLYLLNKEKTVLLKDATAQAIEEYLTNVELE